MSDIEVGHEEAQHELNLIRDRDAHSTIRGFVYQIDLTIQRWLTLDEAETLYPERAEDIDIVARWMTDGGPQLLEQIKNLSGTISLNTSSTRSALAGFHEHMIANPSRGLHFRFSTNARITRERTSHFEDNIPGIMAWNLARDNTKPFSVAFVTALRRTFSSAPKPQDVADTTWTPFQKFMTACDAEEIERFVRSVEFSCNLQEYTATKELLLDLLVSAGYSSEHEAEDAYLILFHYVTRLLCEPPPRKLLRKDIAPALKQRDRRIERIALALRLVADRVTNLEIEFQRGALRLARLESTLNHTDTISTDIVDVPPAPAHQTYRRTVIDSLAGALKPGHLIAVTGQPGVGKTQLLRLVVERLKLKMAWLRLRGLMVSDVALHLEMIVGLFKSETPPELLVLDDLPVLNATSETVRDRLWRILTDNRWSSCSLLSSSLGNHSEAALASLGAKISHFTPPHLDLHEVREIVASMGGALPEAGLRYLLQVTAGHPQMLVAICHYLAEHDWQVTSQVLTGLVKKRFADGLTVEIAQRFMATVTDEGTRDLVQRMRLCITRPRSAQVHAVSHVKPRISDPMTRVSAIDGVWLQREGVEQWALSPLLQCLSSDALEEETYLTCHRALAVSYRVQGSVNIFDVRYVLHHMREGRLYQEFVHLYKDAMVNTLLRTRAPQATGVLRALHSVELPDALQPGDRLVVLALRAAAALELNQKIDLTLLESLASGSQVGRHDQVLIALTLGFRLRGALAVAIVGNAWRSLDPASDDELSQSRFVLILHLMSVIDSPDALDGWLDLFATLRTEERERIEADDTWPGAVMGTISKCLDHAASDDQVRLTRKASALGGQSSMLLQAIAIRAEVLFAADRDLPSAVSMLDDARPGFGRATREQALLIAASVQVANRMEDAEKSRRVAKELFLCDTFGIEYVAASCAIRGAIAASGHWSEAIPFCAYAIEVAQRSDLIHPGVLIRAYGELGVAHWLAGHSEEARNALVVCADKLLMSDTKDSGWRWLVPPTLTVLNYVAATIQGIKLTTTADGSAYAAPAMGLFFNADERYESYYTDEKPVVLAALLVELACRTGQMTIAGRAIALLIDRIQTTSSLGRLMIAMRAGAYLARHGLLLELIGCASSSLNPSDRPELPDLPSSWSAPDQNVLLFGMAQGTLGVCLGFLESTERGQERLHDFCTALRELDRSGSGAHWSDVALVLEGCVAANVTRSTVVKSIQPRYNGVIASSLMLLSSFHPQATPEFSAKAHVLAIAPLWQVLSRIPSATELLLEPFLRDYWLKQLAQQAYRFLRSAWVISEIEASLQVTDIGERVYRLLRLVSDALSINVEIDRSVFV
jgi:hypothetical protein